MVYKNDDYFEYYSRTCKKTHNGKRVWKKHYSRLLNKYYSAISQIIIYEMFSYYLGHGIGNILITKSDFLDKYYSKDEVKNPPVDWPSTYKYWAKLYGETDREKLKKIPNKIPVYYDNEYAYRWFWDKKTSTFNHLEKYMFIASRKQKSLLGKAINKLGYLDYPFEDEVGAPIRVERAKYRKRKELRYKKNINRIKMKRYIRNLIHKNHGNTTRNEG
jgi:hypothetical protein